MGFSFRTIITLLIIVIPQVTAWGQTRIDSLRDILDAGTQSDSLLLATTLQFCKAVVNTDESYLIPEYASRALEVDPLAHRYRFKSDLYRYLGEYYWKTGKLGEAADEFNQMRLLGEINHDTLVIANSYNGLGTVNYLLENNKEALRYYRMSLGLSGTDSLLIIRLYNNIANTFNEMDEMDSVFPYYRKTIDYHKSHQNFNYLSRSYANMALSYSKLGNGLEARHSINLALEAAQKGGDPFQIASVYENMGNLSMNIHPRISMEMFKRSLSIARSIHSYDMIERCLYNLAYISEHLGNLKKTVDYLSDINTQNDSLRLSQRKSRVLELEAEHTSALRRIAEQKQEMERSRILAREDARQKILLVSLVAALITLLVILGAGYLSYRLRMNVTQTKERFFSMMAHDIRSPFSGILGISDLLVEESENLDRPDMKKKIRTLNRSLNQTYELMENLLQWSQAESGKIAFKPEIQLLHPFVHEVVCLHTAMARQKGIRVENQIQSDLKARFDSNMLQTVIRNLLSNAIKFSPGNGTIFISAEISGQSVIVRVKDQGAGMDQEQADRIFRSKEVISTAGTRYETGTGFGLVLCKTFISRHGGEFWADSSPGQGTSVNFSLPD
jgi:signal transduction histidine kinase